MKIHHPAEGLYSFRGERDTSHAEGIMICLVTKDGGEMIEC